jgi:hypothetical protein
MASPWPPSLNAKVGLLFCGGSTQIPLRTGARVLYNWVISAGPLPCLYHKFASYFIARNTVAMPWTIVRTGAEKVQFL